MGHATGNANRPQFSRSVSFSFPGDRGDTAPIPRFSRRWAIRRCPPGQQVSAQSAPDRHAPRNTPTRDWPCQPTNRRGSRTLPSLPRRDRRHTSPLRRSRLLSTSSSSIIESSVTYSATVTRALSSREHAPRISDRLALVSIRRGVYRRWHDYQPTAWPETVSAIGESAISAPSPYTISSCVLTYNASSS